MANQRLDQALVARGIVETRTKAQRRIDAGDVAVDGVVITKPSVSVGEDNVIEVVGQRDYVGRGAHKLIAALDAWKLDVRGLLAVDLGASTGGFTEVLLERGARHVVAIDVGRDQLHASLRGDSRVTLCEGVNARYLEREWWEKTHGGAVDWVVADLSFISLTQIVPAVARALGPSSWIILIKPQFEVGRGAITEGIAQDPAGHETAVRAVITAAENSGLVLHGIIASPITGEAGNREYLCWLSPTSGKNQTQWSQQIHEVTHS
jgi:23S rRNA (cytidine1920-2'-O)/16S rRNA (cytidine1409-2'-O)-methyltransferase